MSLYMFLNVYLFHLCIHMLCKILFGLLPSKMYIETLDIIMNEFKKHEFFGLKVNHPSVSTLKGTAFLI